MDDLAWLIWHTVINIKKDVCVINNVYVWRLCTKTMFAYSLDVFERIFGYGAAGGNDFVVEIL